MDVDEMFAIEEEVVTDPMIMARRMDRKKKKKRNWRRKKRRNLKTNMESNHDVNGEEKLLQSNGVIAESLACEYSENGDQGAQPTVCNDELALEFDLNMPISASVKDITKSHGSVFDIKTYKNEDYGGIKFTDEGMRLAVEGLCFPRKCKGVVTKIERSQELEYGSTNHAGIIEQMGKEDNRRNSTDYEKVPTLNKDVYCDSSSGEEGNSNDNEGKRSSSSDEEGKLRIWEGSCISEGNMTKNDTEMEVNVKKDGLKKEHRNNRTENDHCNLGPDLEEGPRFELEFLDSGKTLWPKNESLQLLSLDSPESFRLMTHGLSQTNDHSPLNFTDDKPLEQYIPIHVRSPNISDLKNLNTADGSDEVSSANSENFSRTSPRNLEEAEVMDIIGKPAQILEGMLAEDKQEVDRLDLDILKKDQTRQLQTILHDEGKAEQDISRVSKITEHVESGKPVGFNYNSTVSSWPELGRTQNAKMEKTQTLSCLDKQQMKTFHLKLDVQESAKAEGIAKLFQTGAQVDICKPSAKTSTTESLVEPQQTQITKTDLVVLTEIVKPIETGEAKHAETEERKQTSIKLDTGLSSGKECEITSNEKKEVRTLDVIKENLDYKTSSEMNIEKRDKTKDVFKLLERPPDKTSRTGSSHELQESHLTQTEFVASKGVTKPAETCKHIFKNEQEEKGPLRSSNVDAGEVLCKEGEMMGIVSITENSLGDWETNSGGKVGKDVTIKFETEEQVGIQTPNVRDGAAASSLKVQEREVASAEFVVSKDVLKPTTVCKVKNQEKGEQVSSDVYACASTSDNSEMVIEGGGDIKTVDVNKGNPSKHKTNSELGNQKNNDDKDVVRLFEIEGKTCSEKPLAKTSTTESSFEAKEIHCATTTLAEVISSKDTAKRTVTSKVTDDDKEDGEVTSTDAAACVSSPEEGEIISSEEETEVRTNAVNERSFGECRVTANNHLVDKTRLKKDKMEVLRSGLSREDATKQVKDCHRVAHNEQISPKNIQEKTPVVCSTKSDQRRGRPSRRIQRNADEKTHEYRRPGSNVRSRSEKEDKERRSVLKHDGKKEQKRERERPGNQNKEKVDRTSGRRQERLKTTDNTRTSSLRREGSIDRTKNQTRQKYHTGKQQGNSESGRKLRTSANGANETRKTSKEAVNKETLTRESCSSSSKRGISNAQNKSDLTEKSGKTANVGKSKIVNEVDTEEDKTSGRKGKDTLDRPGKKKDEKDSGTGRNMETLAKDPLLLKKGGQLEKEQAHGKYDRERDSMIPMREEKSEVTLNKKCSDKNSINKDEKSTKVLTDKLASSKKDVKPKPFKEATSKASKGTSLEKGSTTLKQRGENLKSQKTRTSATSRWSRNGDHKTDNSTDNPKFKKPTDDQKRVNQNTEGKGKKKRSGGKNENKSVNNLENKRVSCTRNKGVNSAENLGLKKLEMKSKRSRKPQQARRDSDVKISGKRRRDADDIERPCKVRKVGKGFGKSGSSIKIKETKFPGKVVTVRILKVERGRALVLKRRHVNQLFVRGDNVIMVAYENRRAF